MFGSCPTATKMPSASISVSSPVTTSRSRMPVTWPSSLAEHLVDLGVQDELDLLVLPRPVDHDRRGAELVAAVDDHDLAREPGEEGRLLHRRVAAAHHHDDLVAEEGAVARRAVRRRRGPGAFARTAGPSWRALAPVATITESARCSSSPTYTRKGRSEKSTRVTSSVTNSAPNRSACRRKSPIIVGPMTPSA